AINGMRTLSITDTQRRITDLEKPLDTAIRDENQPRSEALLDAFWDQVAGNGNGLVRPEYRTVIAIGLDDFASVTSGCGDDVIVGLSDGTTMTGTELWKQPWRVRLVRICMRGCFIPPGSGELV